MRIGHSQLDCDKGFDDRHGKTDLKIGNNINIIFNSQGMEMYSVLPNNSVCALVTIFRLDNDGYL